MSSDQCAVMMIMELFSTLLIFNLFLLMFPQVTCHQETLIPARKCFDLVSKCVPRKCCNTWQSMKIARI